MVLLTFYYLAATSFQSWRLRAFTQKIARVIDSKNTVVFVKKSEDGNREGITTVSAASDICTNSSEATVNECFWSSDLAQALSISPKQSLYLNPFISFPAPAGYVPFHFTKNEDPDASKNEFIHALIEADLIPQEHRNEAAIEIEAFAQMIAWKVDTKMSILVKTDAKKLSQLLFVTFAQNHYSINDNLPLTRIQTVNIDGTPQDFEQILKHSKKDILMRSNELLSPVDWDRHLDDMKSLGVLANQATEFEYKKNLTEGKTGVIVQPDLIPSKNIEETLKKVVKSPDVQRKFPTLTRFESLDRTDDKIEKLKENLKENKKEEPLKEVEESPESPKFPIFGPSPSHSIKSKTSIEATSPKFPIGSPAKKGFFNTDAKKLKNESQRRKRSLEKQSKVDNDVTDAAEQECKPSEEKSPVKSQAEHKALEADKGSLEERKIEIKTAAHIVDTAKPPSTLRKRIIEAKPPNVLVYSESTTTRDNVMKTLNIILKKNTYTVYPLTPKQVHDRIWLDNTVLLVVCGSINGSDVSEVFLEYFYRGGKILCLCSDLLRQVLPTYHTAEVREHELVQFSYGPWKNIKMMHHIFCYQPSPVRKHFSQDSDDPPKATNGNPLIVLPRSVELKDGYGIVHNVHVQVLGTEDTWKTPSLLMVYTDKGGKIIFSQIHLEIDPSFYENDEQKYSILVKNDNLRHEIFGDVLSSHLGVSVDTSKAEQSDITFSKAYFLGRHELKFELLEHLKPKMSGGNALKLNELTMVFCDKNEEPPKPEENCLPIMIHSCPDDFSTLEYFDNLKTDKIGRLVVYAHTIARSMNIVNEVKFTHGFTVIPRILTQGVGRGNNKWLSPEGVLMFSLQVHIPMLSVLGQRIALIQHLVATAAVTSITNIPGYEKLDINVKWPNDIYANASVKIGGLIVNSSIEGDFAICNIGLGVNLSNSIPTTCINDVIAQHNKKESKSLQLLSYEKALAVIFNQIETILNRVQSGDIEYLYQLYYSCWLHSDTSVTVVNSSGEEKTGKILGIDEYGFLKIQFDNDEIESVHPDGNSFDMMRGLIIPKEN